MFLKDSRDLLMFPCIEEIRSRVEIKSLRRQEGIQSTGGITMREEPPLPFKQDGGRRGVCGFRSTCETGHW